MLSTEPGLFSPRWMIQVKLRDHSHLPEATQSVGGRPQANLDLSGSGGQGCFAHPAVLCALRATVTG